MTRLVPFACLAVCLCALPALSQEPGVAKVATVAMHSEMGDYGANLDRLEFWTDKAHAAGATFAVYPELCISGVLSWSKLSFAEARPIARKAMAAAIPRLEKICRKHSMTIVAGTVEAAEEGFYNSALVVGPEGRLLTYRKLWLPNEVEKRWFRVGHELPVIRSQGWAFSVGICADIDRPEFFRAAAANGAELMLCPIGGRAFGELVGPDGDQTRQSNVHKEKMMRFLPSRARDHGLYVFFANGAGKSGDNWFAGLALALDPTGTLVGEHLPTEGMIVTVVSKKVLQAAVRPKAAAEAPRNFEGKAIEVIFVPKASAHEQK